MPSNLRPFALLLSLSLIPVSSARAGDATVGIPIVGRPADLPFSDASGDFRVSARAEPVVVEAQSPITFALRVEAVAPVRQPPRRIDLRELPAFAERFDFLEGDDNQVRRPNPQTWEFVYRIQPKRDDVSAVPCVPFVFFNPEIQYPRKGFQVAYTNAIPLTVRPHEVFPVPLDAPESLFTLATGADLSEALEALGRRLAPWAVALLLLIPPALCLAWYFGWRRWYPDAAASGPPAPQPGRTPSVASAAWQRSPPAGSTSRAARRPNRGLPAKPLRRGGAGNESGRSRGLLGSAWAVRRL